MLSEYNAVLSTIGTILSGIAALAGVLVAVSVWKGQKLLSQRQFLLPLWDKMSTLNDIDPASPVEVDVVKAVNTLEIVALCCEGGMVDEAVVKRTFREGFLRLFTAIEACPPLPGVKKTGRQLLQENKAAMRFGQSLLSEHLDRDALTKA